MSIGPVFGSDAYHDYFYSVKPGFATPSRPAYSAQGGYGGTQLSVGLSKYYKKFWVSLFARYDQLDGAVFADSPLYRKNSSLIAGLVFTWIFAAVGFQGGGGQVTKRLSLTIPAALRLITEWSEQT